MTENHTAAAMPEPCNVTLSNADEPKPNRFQRACDKAHSLSPAQLAKLEKMFKQYQNVVEQIARKFTVPNMHEADLKQQLLADAWQAMLSFDSSRASSPACLLRTSATNAAISLQRAATCGRTWAEGGVCSLDLEIGDEDRDTMYDLVPSRAKTPAEIAELRDEYRAIYKREPMPI